MFDADALHEILRELAQKAAPVIDGPDAKLLVEFSLENLKFWVVRSQGMISSPIFFERTPKDL